METIKKMVGIRTGTKVVGVVEIGAIVVPDMVVEEAAGEEVAEELGYGYGRGGRGRMGGGSRLVEVGNQA